jgi:glycosyltransferase involved in cell wall biosynthesis
VKHKTFASVVLYTRDDQEAVAMLLERVGPWFESHFELYEIVVVDDASVGSEPRITQVATELGLNVVSILLARRHGLEAGIKAGLDRAMGDWVFEIDSVHIDFDLNVLEEMFNVGSQGYDIVTASGDDGPLRSRLFYRFVNHCAELDTPLRSERVRLSSRRALNSMLAMREKVRYRKALYAVLGYRHHHLRYEQVGSSAGRRPLRVDRETWSLAFDILLSFSGFGLRLAHRLSLVFGALSVAVICYAVTVFLCKEDVIQGWTTLTILVSGGFSGLFLILGILGEYLSRILIEVRGRPMYSVRDTFVHTSLGASDHRGPSEFILRQLDQSGSEPPRTPVTGSAR